MANDTPYSAQSISGYNATPPSDDGSLTSANSVRWQTHLDKIGGPLKTLAEAIDGELQTAFSEILPGWRTGQTTAETAAGVTPTNYEYPEGNAKRYGLDESASAATNAMAINNAGLVAIQHGAAVYIPAGTYICNDITLQRTVKYYGDGMEHSHLIAAESASNFMSYTSAASAKIIFEDLWISGNGTDTARSVYIENGYFNSGMYRCRINDAVINVYVLDSWTFTLDGCHLYGAGNDDKGITNNCFYGDGWEAGKIHNCRIEDCLQDAVYIPAGTNNATTVFQISGETSIQRCGRRGVYAVQGGGHINCYFERVNEDNNNYPAMEFDAGGYSTFTDIYLTGSGATTKFCDFTGNVLVLNSCHQTSSGGDTGPIINSGTSALVVIGGRFLATSTTYSVASGVKFVNHDHDSEVQIRSNAVLIGDPASVDGSTYAFDVYAESKNLRLRGDTNFVVNLDSPANRRLGIALLSSGSVKGYIFRADSDDLGDDWICISNAINDTTPIFGCNMANGRIMMATLPTSSAGLNTGELWANSGVLTVV